MKYRIALPKPKNTFDLTKCKIVVYLNGKANVMIINAKFKNSYDFVLDDSYEYLYDRRDFSKEAKVFDVQVEYPNKKGTQIQRYKVVPASVV